MRHLELFVAVHPHVEPPVAASLLARLVARLAVRSRGAAAARAAGVALRVEPFGELAPVHQHAAAVHVLKGQVEHILQGWGGVGGGAHVRWAIGWALPTSQGPSRSRGDGVLCLLPAPAGSSWDALLPAAARRTLQGLGQGQAPRRKRWRLAPGGRLGPCPAWPLPCSPPAAQARLCGPTQNLLPSLTHASWHTKSQRSASHSRPHPPPCAARMPRRPAAQSRCTSPPPTPAGCTPAAGAAPRRPSPPLA